ncbi:MAG: hypothetical protein M3N68_08830 [Actinomycetota bacterium]|nr:hypothetical protein [Actinomycetota bacterium]
MSLTRRQLQHLRHEELHELRLSRSSQRRSRREWLTKPDAVSGRWPVGLGLAWYLAFTVISATTPAATRPAAVSALDAAIHVALFAVIGAMAFGLARRARAGLLASVGGGLLMLTLVVACPVSGHHEQVGAWWFAQLAAFGAVTAASLWGLRRARA